MRTPGPWRIGKYVVNGYANKIYGPENTVIAKVYSFAGEYEAESEVRACNSHDDLLEALELVYNDWEALQHFDSGENAQIVKARVRKIANAALNKAKGESHE
jgi:hypothetical protein